MAVRKSAPKPSSGLPKSSTAVIPLDPWKVEQEPVFGSNPGARGERGSITLYKGLTTNDDFDDRHFPAAPHVKGPIFRGFIANHQPQGPYRLRFMFNPNMMNFQYELNGQLLAFDQTAGIPTAGSIGGHGLGFTMYFNRMYEVAYNGDKLGVYKDLSVLKGLVGVIDNNGWMLMQALKFCFSDTNDGIFYGYIHSLSVQLAYFSEKMVPMMAEVGVMATYVPKTDDPKTLTDYFGGAKAGEQPKPEPETPPPSDPAAQGGGFPM